MRQLVRRLTSIAMHIEVVAWQDGTCSRPVFFRRTAWMTGCGHGKGNGGTGHAYTGTVTRDRKPYAEIHMECENIRDTANAMYELYKAGHVNYGELCLEWQEIFDMVRHGNVMPGTIKLAMELSGGKDG